MKVLIVENDLNRQKKLQEILSTFGECDFAIDSNTAVEDYKMSWIKCQPYDLICMDMMTDDIHGRRVLNDVRAIEKDMEISESEGVKIIMTAELDNPDSACGDNKRKALACLFKPVSNQESTEEICVLGLFS